MLLCLGKSAAVAATQLGVELEYHLKFFSICHLQPSLGLFMPTAFPLPFNHRVMRGDPLAKIAQRNGKPVIYGSCVLFCQDKALLTEP